MEKMTPNNNKISKITNIIIGLGNSGSNYKNTRHNVGFMFIDYMIYKHDLNLINKTLYSYAVYTCKNPNKSKKDPDNQVMLIKMKGFMNTSGTQFKAISSSITELENDNFKIICDDLETEIGVVKNSWVGGDRGHNGIKSFLKYYKNESFEKIKIGIGRPNSHDPDVVSDYVLGSFSKKDIDVLKEKSFSKIENYLNLKC